MNQTNHIYIYVVLYVTRLTGKDKLLAMDDYCIQNRKSSYVLKSKKKIEI